MRIDWKRLLLFGGWLIPLGAVLFFVNTDTVREWRDPRGYWSGEVDSGKRDAEFYAEEVSKCRARQERLASPSARETWMAQKKLEGVSEAKAVADYEGYAKIVKFKCDVFIEAERSNKAKLEKANAKLKEVHQ